MIKSHCLGKTRYSLIIMPPAWGRGVRSVEDVGGCRVSMVTCLSFQLQKAETIAAASWLAKLVISASFGFERPCLSKQEE